MTEHTSPMAPEYNEFPGWSPPTTPRVPELDESPRDKYTLRRTSDGPHAMWAVVGLKGKSLVQFGNYGTAELMMQVLNEELQKANLEPAMPDTAAEQPMTARPRQLKPPMPLKDLQRMYREIVDRMAEDLRKVGAGGDSRIPEDMAEDLIALGWEKRE